MRRRIVYAALPALLLCLSVAVFLMVRRGQNPTGYQPQPAGTITFSETIAPIVFEHCTSCHRPGQSAPFAFLTYEDVRKRAQQIAEVTQNRSMPPWMPEPGYGEFEGSRRLTEEQLGLIGQWVREGAPEGEASRLPPLPTWPADWHLGTPDLVVTMPASFSLAAEGPDIYRNFVIPVPTTHRRFVRAIELDPGNAKVVHHAFIRFDQTRQSRLRDEEDALVGFAGIHGPTSAQPPEGFFLSWQPGRLPTPPREGFSWPLERNTDVVLQMHLQPSGKSESIQARIAFYFTDAPPRFNPLKVWLSSYDIKIPAGANDYLLEDSYVLPGDVEVLSILPHAHYLGKELEAFALLPDGSREELLRIRHWDFNWQGDYRYTKPVALPKGSRIAMRYHYDNSTNNPANPNHPPKEVRYGLQSTDEMGELWLQVLPKTEAERSAITQDYERRLINETVAYNNYLLTLNPNDGKAHSGIGKALYFRGQFPEAAQRFKTAYQFAPTFDEPHYYMGLMFRRQDDLLEAIRAFSTAAKLNPANARAWGNLGQVHLDLRDYLQAEQAFTQALVADPDDALAHDGLGIALLQQGRLVEARAQFQAAYDLAPNDAAIKQRLDAASK